MKRLLFATALALLAPAVHAEDAAPAASVKAETPWLYEGSDIPVDTSWTFGILPNGLKYAVKKNEVPQDQVSIRVRIDAGSLYEEDNELGYAHLMEHLVSRGSVDVPNEEALKIWQRLGVAAARDFNAQTTPTQTAFKLDLPAATPAKLDESLAIISGMVRAPDISEAALKSERAVVLAEMRERSGAAMEQSETMSRHLFQGQRYAGRLPIGTTETLNAATVEGLRAFHSRWYRPDMALVVIAGDAEPSALEALVKKHFGGWSAQGPTPAQPDFGKPAKDGAVAATIIDPSLPTDITLAFIRPWQPKADTLAYNEELMISALAELIINQRLEAQARNGASFTYAGVRQTDESRSADLTFVTLRPLAGDWEKAVADVRAVLADAMKTPPSQADIDRELARFADYYRKKQDSYPFESASVQAEEIVNAVDIRETVAAPDTVVSFFETLRPKITAQRVLEATRALFTADVSRIFLSAPADIPAAETRLAKALTDPVAAAKNVRLADNSVGFEKLPKLGAPGKVVATQKFEQLGVENVEFDNGTRALLFPNEAEDQQVRVLVRFGRGYQSVSPQAGGPFWSGPMVIGQNGIGKLDRTKLNALMNGRRLELSFAVDNDAFEFSATTRPEDLADQLTLIATQMTHPGWLAAPVERAKSLAVSDYDSFEMSALAVMQRDLAYLMSSKDARWKAPTPAEINALTPKSFRAFWEPLLASGPVEVMVFGDFQRDAAVAALQKSFGAMRKRVAAPVPAGAETIAFAAANAAPVQLTHKGPKNQTAAVIAWPTGGGLAGISEGRELEVLATVFRNRLMDKFRSEQGASYSPDIGSRWPDRFTSGGYLIANSQVQPQDVERFYQTVAEVAADLKQNPVTADELQRAVEPLRQYIDRFSSGNMFWLIHLKGAAYTPARFSALGRIYRDYTEVSPARLQELARRYFRDDKAWKLVVSPEG